MMNIIKNLICFAAAAGTAFAACGDDLEAELKSASGKLAIADTIGGEPVVKTMALAWAAINPNLEITIEKKSLLQATEEEKDKYDLVIYSRTPDDDFALEPQGEKFCYAVEPAVIYTNKNFPADNISIQDLSRIFCGDIDSWESITGSPYSIRRYGVVFPAAGERVFRHLVLGQLGYCDAISCSAAAYDVAVNCSGSQYAIGFGGYSGQLPEEVKTLKVDGIEPTTDTIVLGQYPLTHRRMAAVTSGNDNAKLFVRLLNTPECREVVAQSEFVPPLVAEANVSTETK